RGETVRARKTFSIHRAGSRPDYRLDAQLDVFVVDNAGGVRAYWERNAGVWQGPAGLTPQSYAPKGADLSAMYHGAGSAQLDLFVVNSSGAVAGMWVSGATPWIGPYALSPNGVAVAGAKLSATLQWSAGGVNGWGHDQVDWFVVGKNGLLLSGAIGAGPVFGPVPIR
ncbi:MAG TPA: hypothetical protein VF331_15310, partial [Polyangiales bacterium]